jgi:hypothetical protein
MIKSSPKNKTRKPLLPGKGEGVSLEQRTFDHLLASHGPLVDCDAATSLLGFNSRASLLRAVNQGRLPFGLIRPEGRRKTFVSAQSLATYLAALAEKSKEGAM